MCMNVLFLCMFVHCVCVVPVEANRGQWIPWKLNSKGCKLPCGWWMLNPGPQEEHPTLLPPEYLRLTSLGELPTEFALFTIDF